jgi:hypothetical protein
MTYVPYNVQPYDRWDTIAHKAYGEAHRYPEILDANPRLAITAMPTPGTVVWVPVIELPTATTPAAGLPPWKR